MALPRCPRCKREFVRRSPARTGWRRLLGAVGLQGFHCQFCDHRFMALAAGGGGPEAAGEPRRDYARVPTRIPTAVFWDGGQAEGTVTDLSIAGCSLETSARLGEGARLRLELRIAPKVPPLVVDGAVVRYAGGSRLGLQFVLKEEVEQERLRQFVLGSSRAAGAGGQAG